jgi:gliding motility-associated-like protein
MTRGVYSFEVFDIGLQEAGDLKCDFVDLGVVPENGQTETDQPYGNYCSGFSDDPYVQSFTSRTSVWFSFITPSSGHVEITAEGATDYPLDVQMAAYRSLTGDCSGFYRHLRSQYTNTDRDETFVLQCLDPGTRIFVLIDGSAQIDRGAFTARVRDLGDIRPVTQLDTTVCSGGSITVGTDIVHAVTGVFTDTLKYGNNCDSIVITNLTVLPALQLTVTQTKPALGIDGMDGVAVATYSGGQGPYTLEWCDGSTADENDRLVADTECCVKLTDAFGCSRDTCFTVEYTTAILPTFSSEAARCNGESTGAFSFSAINGTPPYQFNWQSSDGALTGSGSLAAGETQRIESVPAGDYLVNLDDTFFDTTFVVNVDEPDLLTVELVAATDASCYDFADGSFSVTVAGGTSPYDFNWADQEDGGPDRTGLRADTYFLTVTDANGCASEFSQSIGEPAPFLATAAVVTEVSCFDGADGSVTVTTSGDPIAWNWDTGATTETVADLATGTYSVVVTNADGCQTEAQVLLPQPAAPLTVAIEERSGISCFDSNDGRLLANVAGPFQTLSYSWADGATTAERSNLGPDDYKLVATNERGCTATASYELTAPPAITAEISTRDITCLDSEFSGVVRLDNIAGGRGGFRYALDEGSFGPFAEFTGLAAGAYRATIRDAAGCEIALDAIVQGPPDIYVDLGQDLILPLGDSTNLYAVTNSENAAFDWSHDPLLNERTANVRPLTSGFFQVMVYDTVTFCEAEAQLYIEVDRRPRVYIPSAFSPNGDGNNDRFYIFGGNDVRQVRDFRIFARNGQQVYALAQADPSNPNAGWDGTIRNQSAPIGVYVYTAELEFIDGRRERVSGDVTLVR